MAKERLHYLDWMRSTLIFGVVYAHFNFGDVTHMESLTIDQSALPPSVVINVSAMIEGKYSVFPQDGTSPFGVKICGGARQACVPLLFWISGAAMAFTFKGSCQRLGHICLRLFVVTIIGMLSNGAAWLTSPQDENCSARFPCPGKGILWDFSIDPHNGQIIPWIHQMWFTVALMVGMVIAWPYFQVIAKQAGPERMLLPFTFTIVWSSSLLSVAGEVCQHKMVAIASILVCEAAFLSVSYVMVMPYRPPAVPVRLLQYLCAVLAIVQTGLSPIAEYPTLGLTPAYVCYMGLSALKWFEFGFLMMIPRCCGDADDFGSAHALVSNVWPVLLFVGAVLMPSTNWNMAGMLTYPYLPRLYARNLYIAGTYFTFFMCDRLGQWANCVPQPWFVGYASLVLYVFQVPLMQAPMVLGLREPMVITFVSLVESVTIVHASTWAKAAVCPRRRSEDDGVTSTTSPRHTQEPLQEIGGAGFENNVEIAKVVSASN